MGVLERALERKNRWTISLVCICFALVLVGAVYYVHTLRDDLMDQATSNVQAITQQQQQAFDTFISRDREQMHSFAQYFSKSDSRDEERIREKLTAFSEVDAFYTVINLETGAFYNNHTDAVNHLSGQELETYRALSGADVRNPFVGLYSDDLRFGYYERFTFPDGVPGLLQKSYYCSRVSEDFSVSFYDGEGLSYVVTQGGEILLRSEEKSGPFHSDNIFDMVTSSSANRDNLKQLTAAMDNQETGSITFAGEGRDYVYTYVPVENATNWYLVSVVPSDAVTGEANKMIMDSQAMLVILLVVLVVFLAFILLIWRNRRDMEQKDLEIDYREKQFNLFATYLANNTNDIYMMLDPEEEQVEYISPNVERVLGLSEKEILADVDAINTAKHVSGGPIGFERLRQMEVGESIDPMLTERINAKTQEHKWFRETMCCVSLQDRKKIIVYISDRTKEHQTKEALTEALDMAQEANKAKSSFLGSVSHDIRTPMNAIMGLTMLLRDEADNPERVLEYVQRIDGASQHLLGLINDVLDMNKIEGGGTTLNITELSLPEIIEEMNTIIRPQTRAKNQSFKIFASSFTSEHLLGDKLRINQILINILSNAVKYTPEGGSISLSVNELPQKMKNYSHVQFVVKDNGQGMSKDYLEVIFDPFTREQNAKTNEIQGTGLGMAITQSLVKLMGGTIGVESELGKGSTFTVELELKIQETEDDPEFWKANGLTRMIVADDEEAVCLNVVKVMSKTNVVVHYATTGQEALRAIREARERGEPYDLMLLDWKMPDLDGLETARLVRKNYPVKIPILFFTAYDWRDIEAEALEVGVDHFLPKPFFLYSFKEAILRVMGKTDRTPTIKEQGSAVKGKRILVVDDVEVNRMILIKILNTQGASCDTAENGQVAVDKFNSSQHGEYDIILMDVQMPVLDGYAATREIRAGPHPDAKSVAIIAMTANAFVDDVRDAVASGMDAHVSKPIVLDQLNSTIQEVLARKESNTDAVKEK